MAEVVLNTIFQLKRGNSDAWAAKNPILRAAEPGYELDTGKLKIGDGVSAWNDLAYFGGDFEIAADGKSIKLNNKQLELAGFVEALAGQVPRKNANGEIEWYTPIDIGIEEILQSEEFEKAVETNVSEILQGSEEEPGLETIVEKQTAQISTIEKEIEKIENIYEQRPYEITNIPNNVIVDYRDKEVRIMFPEDMEWQKQAVGATGNANNWYFGFKAYAPSDDVVSFKEDDAEIINDDTMYYFEGNDFAGIDKNGRKYSIVWLAAAAYDEATDSWTYYGDKSTKERYIGWYYTVEWYNAEGVRIGADQIRINLSNKDCHFTTEDYVMGKYQKITDSISVSRLVNDEDTIFVFNGGTIDDIY